MQHSHAARWAGLTAGLWLWLQAAAAGATGQDQLCLDAARAAAAATQVPLSVLVAITLTETGRGEGAQVRPWPWAANGGGESHWFDTATDAAAYARDRIASGATSFDLGCFQLNYRWHGGSFASVEEMLEPTANALYAARFLARLHAETGDWSRAAGAYHSRTEERAARYRARFDAFYAAADGEMPDDRPQLAALAVVAPGRNAFPLLRAGAGAGTLGSLVPLAGSD